MSFFQKQLDRLLGKQSPAPAPKGPAPAPAASTPRPAEAERQQKRQSRVDELAIEHLDVDLEPEPEWDEIERRRRRTDSSASERRSYVPVSQYCLFEVLAEGPPPNLTCVATDVSLKEEVDHLAKSLLPHLHGQKTDVFAFPCYTPPSTTSSLSGTVLCYYNRFIVHNALPRSPSAGAIAPETSEAAGGDGAPKGKQAADEADASRSMAIDKQLNVSGSGLQRTWETGGAPGGEEDDADEDEEDGGCYDAFEATAGARKYILCLAYSFNRRNGFTLFHSELNQYCQRLAACLRENPDPTSLDKFLSSWFSSNMQYVARCVARCGPMLHSLLHAVLMCLGQPAGVRVHAASPEDETVAEEMERFIRSLTIKNLDTGSEPDERSECTLSVGSSQPPALSCPASSNPYCEEWAAKLIAAQEDPLECRALVRKFKLAVTDEVETARSEVARAEGSNYELYRAYAHISASGNKDVLLRFLARDQESQTEALEVLQEFIALKGSNKKAR